MLLTMDGKLYFEENMLIEILQPILNEIRDA